ncbi:MAG: acyltransferase family protein [Ilumatobacteraceae bacterium]
MSIIASNRRSDIEGLRALAVLLVVAYHYGVEQIGGGFVGVDVFFVISGFLITKLLIDEAARDGNIHLSNFWARRIRRIIPMSLLVVVVTVIAGLYMLEPGRARELSTVALGAVGFCANFVLYFTTGNYLSGVTPPSPLQHYWSLAIEEQFYLFWPLILFAVIKLGRTHWKKWIAVVVAVLGASSLMYSIAITPKHPELGYYMPQARIWEILAGAGLAVLGTQILKVPQRLRAVVGWLGLSLIMWSAVSFNTETAFPGWAALLPVLGTVGVLAAVETEWGPQKILRIAPAQHVGAWSYSLYLWHWPVLVLVESRFGIPSVPTKLALFVACLLLSVATYTYIEQPTRRHVWLSIRPWRSVIAGVTAIAIGLTGALALYEVAPRLDARSLALATPSSPAEVSAGSGNLVRPTTKVPEPAPIKVVRSKNLVNVLLLGDSTMAALRWFEQGTVSLDGFNFKLDAESCRRISDSSCYGREKRKPTSALSALKEFEGPLDYVILMAGYDSSVKRVDDELKRFIEEVHFMDVKLIILNFKESLKFPSPGSRGKRSVYADFNKILRDLVAADDSGDVVIADWNLFSWGKSQWFLRDGIHLSIEGSVALGWYISHLVANAADNSCPFSDIYPCAVPEMIDPRIDLMTEFDVQDTEIQCYEDGAKRKPVCTRDRRL